MHTVSIDRLPALERFSEGLVSGQRFLWAYESHKSADRMTPRGPITAAHYAAIIETLGKYARMSDRAAATTSAIVGKVNLYGTPGQVLAAIAQSLSEIAANGYTDVVGATGPWAGRPSDHKHETTLREGIMLELLWNEVQMAVGAAVTGTLTGIGWALEALVWAEEINPHHLRAYLPKVAARLIEIQDRRTADKEAAK